jgi:hypothetical protein
VNKDLYGKEYEVPSNILNNLQKFKDEKTIGNILNSKKITYSNLKKIKNRMENGEMDKLGGQYFKNWVDETLGSDRRGLDTSKKTKKNSGVSNSYISQHTKRTDIRPSERHRKTSEKHDTWDDNSSLKLEQKVVEELKIINELIKKII